MSMVMLMILGSSIIGGAAIWGGNALREKLKARRYLRWRSGWHLLRGGMHDGRC